MRYFSFECPKFQEHFDSLWADLTVKFTKDNHFDGRQISEFIVKLDWHQIALLLFGYLLLLFDAAKVAMIT